MYLRIFHTLLAAVGARAPNAFHVISLLKMGISLDFTRKSTSTCRSGPQLCHSWLSQEQLQVISGIIDSAILYINCLSAAHTYEELLAVLYILGSIY